MNKMSKEGLESKNDEYLYSESNWQMIRDLVKGKKALANRDLGRIASTSNQSVNNTLNNQAINQVYLPMPEQDSEDCINGRASERYRKYIQRACLYNATIRTEKGMSGMVFSKPTEIDLPSSMEYLKDDSDGSGVGIAEQAVEVFDNVLETGRAGLFVDYPIREQSTTIAEQEQGLIRASIIEYKAEQILDWFTVTKNAKQVLSMVKLCESRTEIEDFQTKNIEMTRILFLDEDDGFYKVRIYKSSDDFEESIPKDANGQPFNEIPFYFVGSVNNRPNVDVAPLLEIAEVNIGHYRNSADFEESAFLVGQPTLTISGLNQAWVDRNFKNGIKFGSRSGIPLPDGSSAQLLQAQEVTMTERAMKEKEQQMISLGARLITDGGAPETAEAARIKHSADSSVLSVIVKNINLAYVDAIKMSQRFNERSNLSDFVFAVNTDFFTSKLSPQEMTALVQSWQGGAFDQMTLLKNLQKGKIIDPDENLENIIDITTNEMNDE